MDSSQPAKFLLEPVRTSMQNFDPQTVLAALQEALVADAQIRLAHPIGTVEGPLALYHRAYAPLYAAVPDLERRDYIVIGGTTEQHNEWVGCAGCYLGTFINDWLNIPATGHLLHMRFHEFYRIEENKVVEIQAVWDIPEVMMQASAWPMAPSLGREWNVPGPATQDGIHSDPCKPAQSARSLAHVMDMLAAMTRHPAQGGPEVMELEKYWHPRFNWYGPAGIGTGRGIAGFRHWHQIPFLNAMPDRSNQELLKHTHSNNERSYHEDHVSFHFFAEQNYVAVTGWPNMIQTLSNDGWMGIAPGNQKVCLRSLDFWRLENGLIRENWVLIDLLDMYRQLGIDVFARLKEFNKARAGFDRQSGVSLGHRHR